MSLRIKLPLAAALALALPAVATAHSALVSSSPKDGAVVARVPARVVLVFAQVPAKVGLMSVMDLQGRDIVARVRRDRRDARRVVVTLKPGAAGRYRTTWRVMSPDAHRLTGTFSFTARAAGGAP